MTTEVAPDTAQVSAGSTPPAPNDVPPAASAPADAATEPAVSSEAPATGVTSESPPATGDVETPPTDARPARKPASARISEVIAERDFWRSEALKGNKQETPAEPAKPAEPEGPPTLEQFNGDPDAWSKAYATWSQKDARRAVSEHLAAERENERVAQVVHQFEERETKFFEATPDYREAVSDPDLRKFTTPTISEVIVESDVGPQLSYYLATHRDELATISKMKPTAQARALAKIEGKLTATPAPAKPNTPAPPARQVTRAPAPPTPVGAGGGASTKKIEDMPMDEYMAHRAANWSPPVRA